MNNLLNLLETNLLHELSDVSTVIDNIRLYNVKPGIYGTMYMNNSYIRQTLSKQMFTLSGESGSYVSVF